MEASCVLVDVAKRWVLDELPAEFSAWASIQACSSGSKRWMVLVSKGRGGRALGGGLVEWRDNWALWTGWVSHGGSRVLRRALLRVWSSSCWGKD